MYPCVAGFERQTDDMAVERQSVEIRKLTTDDWELWREVRLQALSEAPDAFSSVLADWQGDADIESRWRNRLRAVPFNVIAVMGDQPAGQASGTDPDADGYVDVLSMWVAPDLRRQGVGRALVESVFRYASSQASQGMKLDVRRTNDRAIAFYERCGFLPTLPRPDTGDDKQVMVRRCRNERSHTE
jgi:ribosomal protein S18 acetylase RimI-like enzyme